MLLVPTVELDILLNPHSFLSWRQILNWLEYFPREQLLIMKAEDFYADTSAAMNKITEFIGLAPIDVRWSGWCWLGMLVTLAALSSLW